MTTTSTTELEKFLNTLDHIFRVYWDYYEEHGEANKQDAISDLSIALLGRDSEDGLKQLRKAVEKHGDGERSL